jgi:hypothetical protein
MLELKYKLLGSVAQLAEQLTLNQHVAGSSPAGVTGKDSHSSLSGFFVGAQLNFLKKPPLCQQTS